MIIRKWNWKKHKYEDYFIPDDRNICLYAENLENVIDCASCGKPIKVRDSYTSIELHNDIGLGYMVCDECYKKEWAKRKMSK